MSLRLLAGDFLDGGSLFFSGTDFDGAGREWCKLFDPDGATFEHGLFGYRIPLFLREFVCCACSGIGAVEVAVVEGDEGLTFGYFADADGHFYDPSSRSNDDVFTILNIICSGVFR